MKSFGVRICVAALSLLCVSFSAAESQAAGPVSAQLAVTQVHTALSDASAGFHRWGGYGRRHGGFGYGGFGYSGYGSGRGWGGYSGYAYARPTIYAYPSYSYASYRYPRYYSGYSYASPYRSSGCCCATYQPAVYSISSYSYASPPVVYSAPINYSGVSYGSPAAYSIPTYNVPNYGNSTYSVPAYSAPAYPAPAYNNPVYSSPSVISPAPAPAPYPSAGVYSVPSISTPVYPAPPSEISSPSVRRAPVAARTLPGSSHFLANQLAVYSYSGTSHAANAPTIEAVYSGANPVAMRVSHGLVW